MSKSNELSLQKQERESGIELLKIIALLLIIISHLTQTLSYRHLGLSYPEFVIPIDVATYNVQTWVLVFYRHFGALGNMIFFIASFWFLSTSEKFLNTKKIIVFILDVWIISVLIWGAVLISGIDISWQNTVKSFFPITFANNWFITCYLLIFAAHPLINQLIRVMSQKTHLVFCLVTCGLYFVAGTFKSQLFFSSPLLVFITLYFLIAYTKKYLYFLCNNFKANFLISIIGLLFQIFSIIILELLGSRFPIIEDKMVCLASNQNIMLLLAAFGLFNIARRYKFTNVSINIIASVSLFVYLIHENILIRDLIRPYFFTFIHNKFGYDEISLWILLIGFIVYVLSTALGLMYKFTLQRLSKKIASFILEKTSCPLNILLERLLGLVDLR